MFDVSAFAAGFALSAALIVAIGAQNAFVLRQGLRREHVGAIVAFCTAADALLMALGVAGLARAVGALPGLERVLAGAGAAFLAVYAAFSLRRAMGSAALTETAGTGLTLRGALLRAAGFTFLNPHVYLESVLLVGAVGAARAPDAPVAFVVGAASASLVWFAGLGYGARALAPVFAKPAAWRALDLGVAATMLALAAGLAGVAIAGAEAFAL
ncbi:MAG: LysE/ArgO family amino acid transporter [Tagaea sp.]